MKNNYLVQPDMTRMSIKAASLHHNSYGRQAIGVPRLRPDMVNPFAMRSKLFNRLNINVEQISAIPMTLFLLIYSIRIFLVPSKVLFHVFSHFVAFSD